MKRSGRKQEWSLALFILGCVLLFPPLVTVFDKPTLVFGLPLMYLVLFGFWGLMIAGIWWGARPTPLRSDPAAFGDKGPREPTFDHADLPPHTPTQVR